MNKKYCYDYPRPSYTSDCVVFTEKTKNAGVVLIRRKNEPFKNMWALPGGFVEINEKGRDACKRELFEETGIVANDIFELGIYDTPERDPRGRTVSVVFYTFNRDAGAQIKAGDDALEVKLFSIINLPDLAFDHEEIIAEAIKVAF